MSLRNWILGWIHKLPSGSPARLKKNDWVVLVGAGFTLGEGGMIWGSLGREIYQELRRRGCNIIVLDQIERNELPPDCFRRTRYIKCDLADPRTNYRAVWEQIRQGVEHTTPHVIINSGVIHRAEQMGDMDFSRHLKLVNLVGPSMFLEAMRYTRPQGDHPVVVAVSGSISALQPCCEGVPEYGKSKRQLLAELESHCLQTGDHPCYGVLPAMSGSEMERHTTGALDIHLGELFVPPSLRTPINVAANAMMDAMMNGDIVFCPAPDSAKGRAFAWGCLWLPRMTGKAMTADGRKMLDPKHTRHLTRFTQTEIEGWVAPSLKKLGAGRRT